MLGIYDEKADPKLTVRRLTVTANRLMREEDILREPEQPVQFSLFDDPAARERQLREEEVKQERERRIQEAMLGIKKKYGKNAILSGGSYLEDVYKRQTIYCIQVLRPCNLTFPKYALGLLTERAPLAMRLMVNATLLCP